MAVEDDLRLAWRAARDGRRGMRDALLTLAVAASGPGDAVWAGRCRRLLIARKPDHPFASFPTLGLALADRRVAAVLRRLRRSFPPARVRHLLLRSEVLSGPFTGRRAPLSAILAELLDLEPSAPPGPPPDLAGPDDSPESLRRFSLTVLLAIAVLLECVLEPSRGQGPGQEPGETRAA